MESFKNIVGFYLNLKMLEHEDVFRHFFNSLSGQRQQKLEKLKVESSRRRSLGAWTLMDYGLQQLCGLREREVQIAYGVQGKPYVQDMPEICFNLSHSGDYALTVFAPTAIGCDIQKTASIRNNERIAARFFTEAEQRAVAEGMDFYRIWARKESYVKCTGEGMACDLLSFDVAAYPLDDVRSVAKESADSAVYHFAEHFMTGYAMALCYQWGEALPVIWKELQLEHVMKCNCEDAEQI